MNKIEKRLRKNFTHKPLDCLVIGEGFGLIPALLNIYDTVFVHSRSVPETKDKKLIWRKEIKSCYALTKISAIYVDLEYKKALDYITPLFHNPGSEVIIEGSTPLEREHTVGLYSAGYQCIATCDNYHIWKKVK